MFSVAAAPCYFPTTLYIRTPILLASSLFLEHCWFLYTFYLWLFLFSVAFVAVLLPPLKRHSPKTACCAPYTQGYLFGALGLRENANRAAAGAKGHLLGVPAALPPPPPRCLST